ncbi:DUF4129 domain-containing protein [Candidatus Oscillochloris fontis]|uniref:DUF4129 domain-containing protein n=1 Tax=Candidatus Oscillochloris fontis TaxID=2496868 RepID=UPI00101B7C4B|nr:DUF4129 domain-containing protein [Candidatus Oscillochloris fontis]
MYQRWLLCILTLALFWTPAAHAAPVPFETYLRLLREAHTAAERGDQLGLAAVVSQLVELEQVQLADGRMAPVDNRWLAEAMQVQNPDLPQIATRIGALLDALTASTGPPDPAATERLHQILAAPPFTQPDPPETPQWLRDFFEWLADMFGAIAPPVAQSANDYSDPLAWIFVLIGLILVAVILFIWVRGLRRTLVPITPMPSDDPEAHLRADEAAQQAAELARQGEYRRAARMLYLSALLWLDEHGRLRYDRTLTNREYLEHLNNSPHLREGLRPVVETFDQVWYGDVRLDARSFATYAGQVAALRELPAERGGTS